MSGKIYWCQSGAGSFYKHRILYQQESGRIAFDIDELSSKSLISLLRGGVGWNYEEDKWDTCKDFHFTGYARKPEVSGSIVSFYDFETEDFVDSILSMSQALSRAKYLDHDEKEKVVLKALSYFKVVAVWDLDYCPIVFSKDKASFLSFLERLPQEAEIIEVEEESKMPVW